METWGVCMTSLLHCLITSFCTLLISSTTSTSSFRARSCLTKANTIIEPSVVNVHDIVAAEYDFMGDLIIQTYISTYIPQRRTSWQSCVYLAARGRTSNFPPHPFSSISSLGAFPFLAALLCTAEILLENENWFENNSNSLSHPKDIDFEAIF